MITSVTTSTVSTITVSTVSTSTVSSAVASGALLAAFGLAAMVTLIVALAAKEVVVSGVNLRLHTLGRNLDVVIYPLLFVFAFIAFSKITAILY